MKKLIVLIGILIPSLGFAQFGLKAGLNFANVTSASSINSNSRSGFHAGVIFGPKSKGILSYRTELLYSKQGFDYATDSATGNVDLDYIISTHLMCINITKYVQIQLGGQAAILLNAKADSTSKINSNSGSYPSTLSYYNQFDYGFGGGLEIHPVLGLLIGARYNISLSKLYSSAYSGQLPSFSSVNAKNNVVQIFVGWLFGKKSDKKNKQ
jgi:Outer membrane protein beta-barrel domain